MNIFSRRNNVDLAWLQERVDNLEQMLYTERDRSIRLERRIVTLESRIDKSTGKVYIMKEKTPIPDGSKLRQTPE